jgi:lipoprotein-releasing system permease protein
VFYADPFDAPLRTRELAAVLGTRPGTDWTVEHAAYFSAIRLEKAMMTVILLLIVSVAAFNVVASLVMVVAEKRNDIAILRTLGLSRAGVVATFIIQGTVIGWIGALAGLGLGILLALNAGTIVHALEGWFGFELFDPAVYYISRIPSELRSGDVALVSATAFALTLLATIYPARRAAATEPAEALRYE